MNQTVKHSKKHHIIFAILAVIGLSVVFTHTFAQSNPNSKLIAALDDKGVQYIITNGEMFVIDDSNPKELCDLVKANNGDIKTIFNSKLVTQADCK